MRRRWPRDGARRRVAAWFVPETVAPRTRGFRIKAHTDSPAFSVKPSVQSTTPDGWGQTDVEVYGGMMWNSWLIALTLAGRLTEKWRGRLMLHHSDCAYPSWLIPGSATEGLKLIRSYPASGCGRWITLWQRAGVTWRARRALDDAFASRAF